MGSLFTKLKLFESQIKASSGEEDRGRRSAALYRETCQEQGKEQRRGV
jgi:hypothetical protein